MTVNVGVMQLPVTEDPDPVRTYLNGTHPSGGLWTALTRASNHDHSGGLNGVVLGATSIPDGSITAAKLDPSVLLPYALVDGSKPFTGTVTMNADQLIRDTLRFGAKPAGVADATLARTGAGALRVDTNLGLGVAVESGWAATQRVLRTGMLGAVYSPAAGQGLWLAENTYYDGTNSRAIAAAGASAINVQNGTIGMYTMASVAAGAAQTFTTRASIAPTGTLTLSPDAGQPAIQFSDLSGTLTGAAVNLAPTSTIYVQPGGGYMMPGVDNTKYVGHPSFRFAAMYALSGMITTSSATVKQGITPLSPLACYEAAKSVRWYEYAYLPPAYTAPEPPPDIAYDAADDNETKAEKKAARDEAEAASKAAHLKMVTETAPARHQRGFVFPAGAESKDEAGGALPPVPDLFGLSDRQSTTPQADLATLGCALQEVIRRLEALEAPN